MADDESQKKHAASGRKLRQAREKGDIPKSKDFVAGAVFAAVILWIAARSQAIISDLQDMFRTLLTPHILEEGIVSHAALATLSTKTWIFYELIAVAVAAAIIANIAENRGLILAAARLNLDITRISPIKGLERIFGKENASNSLRTLLKFALMTAAMAALVYFMFDDILKTHSCELECGEAVTRLIITQITAVALIILLMLGVIDIIIQQQIYAKRQKMSDQERKQENKSNFGSPEVRRARARLQKEAAQEGKTIRGLGHSNLIIYGDFYGAALFFDREKAPTPIIVAKGRTESLSALMDYARENQVETFFDPELAETLATSCRPGDRLPQTEFQRTIVALRATGLV